MTIRKESRSMIERLRAVLIAVRDIEEASRRYASFLNLIPSNEIADEEGVRICSFNLGDVMLALISPLESNKPLIRFLEQKGEGLFGISLEADSAEQEIERIELLGIEFATPLQTVTRTGEKYVWTRPRSLYGTAFEIAEFPK